MPELTAERLREVLSYEPDTGVFRWRVSPCNRAVVGNIAGSRKEHGYRVIGVDGNFYFEHRLVWLHVHGHWPRECLDHKNGARDDNRLSNLREATNSLNQRNRKSTNKSGFKGVTRSGRRWRAQIKPGAKPLHLGTFSTPEEAHAAYCKAAKEAYGEFARFA